MRPMTAIEVDIEIGQMEIVAAEQEAKALLLPEWGLWKRRGNSLRHLDYPPCLLDFRGKGSDSADLSQIIGEISDEEGHKIETAVRALPKPYRLLITALYLAKLSVRRLAEMKHCDRRDIDHMHNRALGMLSEKLR